VWQSRREPFGSVGDATICINNMVRGIRRTQHLAENIEHLPLEVDSYMKELAKVNVGSTWACPRPLGECAGWSTCDTLP
jgi:hypothetical protein